LGCDSSRSVAELQAIGGVQASCERSDARTTLSSGIEFLKKQASISVLGQHLAGAAFGPPQDTLKELPSRADPFGKSQAASHGPHFG
jgi:hypothetical protein